jgi:hypothetical protein
MAEINKKELRMVVGHDEDSEYLKKEVSIIKDKRQFTIRIPIKFAELVNLNQKKDKFKFTLVPLGIEEKQKFTLEADLIKEENV